MLHIKDVKYTESFIQKKNYFVKVSPQKEGKFIYETKIWHATLFIIYAT